MGIVFGMTGTKEPSYSLLTKAASGYEVRQYQKYFIAEVPHSKNGNGDDFRVLAKYIGVFGTPENVSKKPMAMTAPVLMDPSSSSNGGQKMAMTSPVLQTDKTMSFVLPFEFQHLEEVPKPSNSQVQIKEAVERTVAVDCFSGWYSDDVGQERFTTLCEKLKKDGILDENDIPNWSVAQYHPPFTLPFLRRNEIWIDVNKNKVNVDQ